MKIAFYAPMKSPWHPVPSGDRLMARQLLRALQATSTEVRLASEFRFYSREPCNTKLNQLQTAATTQVKRLIAAWEDEKWYPDIWFSYHPYYKSPDVLGPPIVSHFGAVMVTAEASFSQRRTTGPWAQWHRENLAGLEAARCHFYMTERDRRGLEDISGLTAKLVHLPPFIDSSAFQSTAGRQPATGALRLATVAMMRADVKRQSYQFQATALEALGDIDWTIDIVGDGEGRPDVENAFSNIPANRITWHGRLDRDGVVNILQNADVFVWPGINEGYGLAYLEAQAAGLPVVALNSAGVPEVVRHGETGLLIEEGDHVGFANAIRQLLSDRHLLSRLSNQARKFVLTERSFEQAQNTLADHLTELVVEQPA